MPLSAEERAEINRKNAARSRGPVTPEGKARSCGNALKHGLRAEVLPLPDEDSEAVRARQDAWQDYYQPRSPAAQHLLDQCVRATLLADRCDAYHHAALSRQIRLAEDRWEDGRADEVGRLKDSLADDPATAVRHLRRSGHGCRWLIGRWEALAAALESQGYWRPEERAEAIRLLGEHPEPLRTTVAPQLNNAFGYPEPERSRYSYNAFAIHLCSLICQPDRSPKDLGRLMESGRMPYTVNGGHGLEAWPVPAVCLAELRRVVADELERLRPLENRLRVEVDDPDRAEATRRELILDDPGEARLFLRYHAEARTSFHRAYKELLKALEADDDASSPNEPKPAEAVPPNEPKSGAAAGTSSAEGVDPAKVTAGPPMEGCGAGEDSGGDCAVARRSGEATSTGCAVLDEATAKLPVLRTILRDRLAAQRAQAEAEGRGRSDGVVAV